MTTSPVASQTIATVERAADVLTLFARSDDATILGDYGADVLKVEHPSKADPARTHGPAKDGVPLWWTSLGRNKRTITLALNTEAGAELLLRRTSMRAR